MKKQIFAIAIVAFGASSPLFSDAASKIALLDVNRITSEASAAKDLNESIKNLRDKFQKDLDQRAEALRKEEEALGKARETLPVAEFQAKQVAFSEKVRDLNGWAEKKNEELQVATQEAMQKFRDEVEAVTGAYGKAQKYDMIIPKQVPVYAATSMPDVTNDVIKKLDKKLPKLTLKVKSE